MDIVLSLIGEIPVFHLSGRLDVITSPFLEDRLGPLLEKQGQKVIFDCKDLTFTSSAGLRVFILALRHLSAKGGGMALASLSKPVAELIHLAGLDTLFLIEPSVDAAVARLNKN